MYSGIFQKSRAKNTLEMNLSTEAKLKIISYRKKELIKEQVHQHLHWNEKQVFFKKNCKIMSQFWDIC